MNNIKRRDMHEMAMKAVYDELTYVHMGEEVDVKKAVEAATELPYDEAPRFVKEQAIAALKYLDEAINAIQSHMRGWTFERLDRVEQAVLINAYNHFFHVEEGIDKKIVINNAVELAKDYLEEKDYRFVNAILDNILVRA